MTAHPRLPQARYLSRLIARTPECSTRTRTSSLTDLLHRLKNRFRRPLHVPLYGRGSASRSTLSSAFAFSPSSASSVVAAPGGPRRFSLAAFLGDIRRLSGPVLRFSDPRSVHRPPSGVTVQANELTTGNRGTSFLGMRSPFVVLHSPRTLPHCSPTTKCRLGRRVPFSVTKHGRHRTPAHVELGLR